MSQIGVLSWEKNKQNFTTLNPPAGVKVPAFSWIEDWKKLAGKVKVVKSTTKQPDARYTAGWVRKPDCSEAIPAVLSGNPMVLFPVELYDTEGSYAAKKADLDKFVIDPMAAQVVMAPFCPSGTTPGAVAPADPSKPAESSPSTAAATEVPWYSDPHYWMGVAAGAAVMWFIRRK